MHSLTNRQQAGIGVALAVLMLVTRGPQLALAGQHLPDASLVVFFLAGLYLRPLWAFPALFSLGFAIDAAAVTWGGVSGFCFTPAYGFLVPAYAAMWLGGRWYGRRHRNEVATLVPLVATLLTAAVAAEFFASGGFYLFSGNFAQTSLLGFGASLVAFLPQTLSAVGLYAMLAALVHVGVTIGHRIGRGTAVPR